MKDFIALVKENPKFALKVFALTAAFLIGLLGPILYVVVPSYVDSRIAEKLSQVSAAPQAPTAPSITQETVMQLANTSSQAAVQSALNEFNDKIQTQINTTVGLLNTEDKDLRKQVNMINRNLDQVFAKLKMKPKEPIQVVRDKASLSAGRSTASSPKLPTVLPQKKSEGSSKKKSKH